MPKVRTAPIEIDLQDALTEFRTISEGLKSNLKTAHNTLTKCKTGLESLSPDLNTAADGAGLMKNLDSILPKLMEILNTADSLGTASDSSNLERANNEFVSRVPYELTMQLELNLLPESELLIVRIDELKKCKVDENIDTESVASTTNDIVETLKKLSNCLPSIHEPLGALQTELNSFISSSIEV